MSSRKAARIVAFQLLYQNDSAQCPVEETLEQMSLFPMTELDESGRKFVEEIVRGTLEQREEIDELLRSLTQHWKLERVAVSERNILRLAVFEMFHRDDAPPRAVINEAVNLAKRFGDEKSGAFVNGILDAAFQKKVGDETKP